MMIKPETYRSIVSGQRKDLLAGCVRTILGLIECPYRLIVGGRNRLYDQRRFAIHRVDAPVVSVGNLTLGGTGKTPMVAWLAEWFRDRQVRVSIVSRGYGAATSQGNDESKELAERLSDVPHLQDPDRVAAAKVAIDQHETQLILLDDGFQHRRIARDVDVVLIDATEPFGFDHVFPRGMLREPIENIDRADIVVLTRCNLVSNQRREELRQKIRSLAPGAIWVEVAQRPASLLTAGRHEITLDELPPGPLLAFCGIGNPVSFRRTITDQGWLLEDFREFPDHHPYDQATINSLHQWVSAHPSVSALMCTHKDLVKIDVETINQLPIFALTLKLEILRGRSELEARLKNLLKSVAAH